MVDCRQFRKALNDTVERHARWVFWKCFRALRKHGHSWNHKRVYRVYCELRLNQKRRTKRRLPKRIRQPLLVPQQPNQVWSADFVSDARSMPANGLIHSM